MKPSRRQFAKAVGMAGAALAFERLLSAQTLRTVPGGRLIRSMPVGRFDGRPTPPMHTLLGSGLDARQFTDLSDLASDRLVTPADRFFIRTAHPSALPDPSTWLVHLGGMVKSETAVDIAVLRSQAGALGTHLMECSGNADPANFGLLSAASFDGVPLEGLLNRVQPRADARRIRVTGIDDAAAPSRTSMPGAAWVFTRDELQRAGAFLATAMNGAPLTPDHGAPIRLVVPNYYGCSCIKWVTRIDWAPDDDPATSQMQEFSARTHQEGIPRAARDYEPPVIDLAATPIRVEQWSVEGRIVYRVVGIRWGGTVRTVPLTIRFRHTEPFVLVEDCPASTNPTTWTLWSHTWKPEAPGRYQIALGVSDRTIRTRRLDLFYYTREVEIDRV